MLTIIAFLFGVPALLAMGISAVLIAFGLVFILLMLAIRFWYITLAVLVIMALPVLYLEGHFNGSFMWFLGTIGTLILLSFFIPKENEDHTQEKTTLGYSFEMVTVLSFGWFILFYNYIAKFEGVLAVFFASLFTTSIINLILAIKYPSFVAINKTESSNV